MRNISIKNKVIKVSVMVMAVIVIVLTVTVMFCLFRQYRIDTFNFVERNGGKYVLQTATLVNDFPNKDTQDKINRFLWEKLVGSYINLDLADDAQKCDGESYIKDAEINNSWLSFRQDYFFFCETAAHPCHGLIDYNIDLNTGSLVDLNIDIEKNVENISYFRESLIGRFIKNIPELHSYFHDGDISDILDNYHPSYLVRDNRLILRLEGFGYAVQSFERHEIDLTFKELCQYFKPNSDSILTGFCK